MTATILDDEAIEQLFMFDEDGDDNFSKEMLDTFRTQAQECLQRMRLALRDHDYNDLSRAGHFLKGSSVTLGSVEVPSICANIEHHPTNVDDRQLTELENAICRYFQAIDAR